MWVALVALIVFTTNSAAVEKPAVEYALSGNGDLMVAEEFPLEKGTVFVFIPEKVNEPGPGGKIVDVLYLYTTLYYDTLVASIGGEEAALAEIQRRAEESVLYKNISLHNTKAVNRVELCDIVEVEFVETGDLFDDLEAIQAPANEHKDVLGCDTGMAFIDRPQSPGTGSGGAATLTTDPERSTAVLLSQANLSTASHEFGHNGLCKHNIEDVGQPVFAEVDGEFFGAHGHWAHDPLTVDPTGGSGGAFRTNMAVSCPEAIAQGLSCPRVPHYATASVAINGVPTGDEITSCGDLLDARMRYMADYREKVNPPGPCVPGATKLCITQNRFRVQVTWHDFAGNVGSGQVLQGVPEGSSGIFWFFGPNNWELMIKVLDACTFNDRFWVFSAATTTVEYTLTVTDTQTGVVWEHTNPLGVAAAAVADTDAFATCN
jgi:hypothetical protein